MKRWTWLAMVAATSACSFPTSEFSLGTTRPDVVTADTGAVDTGATDVVGPTDQGGIDVVMPGDVVTPGDVVDSGVPGDVVTVTDAADAGTTDDAPDASAPDSGDPGDVPPVDGGCMSPTITCTVAGASACVNPNNSLEHCGRCNYACNPTNAAPACTDGTCVLNCNAGFADCDRDPRNGCEGALNTITNCGACMNVCPSGAALNGTPACTASSAGATPTCSTTCNAGYANCNGMAADGCETPTANNPANCGMCGRACPSGQSCTAGVCTTVCTAPNLLCSGVCTDVQTSATNCNACGNICPNPPFAVGACRGGVCGLGACNAGYGDCTAAAGCETNINTTPAHCGGCGRACIFPNATATCVAGACVMGSCTGTFRDCDGNPANGCETDTSSNAAHCGACGTVCRVDPRTSNSCVSSRCAPTCNPGYAECDRDASNGCEVSISSNLNCGTCGIVCGVGTTCARGSTCLASTGVTTYARSTGPAYVDVCGNTMAMHLLPSQDDLGVLIPLPFAFTWWGASLPAGAMVNVASNGFMSLQPTVYNNLSGIIPDPLAPDAVIAAWWTDLVTSPAGVCTLVTGTAPNRRFIVQWGDVDYFSGRTGDMNFEIALNESTNTVDLVYSRIATPPAGYIPTVGVENNSGSAATVVCRSTDTACTMVTSGTSFRFTPR